MRNGRGSRWCAAAAAVVALGVVAAVRDAGAAVVAYDVTGKGVSETFAGDKFKFTGTGTMSIDDTTAVVDFSMLLSNGLTFSGQGQAAITSKGKIFALIPATSGGISGQAIFLGKATKDRSKFKGKLTAAVPNRLGPPPAGFVLTTMTLKGERP